MIDMAITEIEPMIGTLPACRALGASRAGDVPPTATAARAGASSPPGAGPGAVRARTRRRARAVALASGSSTASPAEVWATLLDEGTYLASERTMYRLLAANGQVRERRDQLTHPPYARPELSPSAPTRCGRGTSPSCSGPAKWTYFYLYVILDVFSRYIVGWTVQHRETGPIAKQLITQTRPSNGSTQGSSRSTPTAAAR